MRTTREQPMQKLMWTALACAACAAAAAPVAAQTRDERIRAVTRVVAPTPRVAMYQRGGEEQTDRQTRTFKVGAQGEIDVSNLAGDITVTRGGGNDAAVEIVKRARARTADEAREMLGLVQVNVTERNGRVEIRTQYPSGDQGRRANRRNVNVSVSYTIAAPAGTRITAKSLSGDMQATGITGDITFETMSGDVTISGAARIASAKSLSGDITVSDSQLEGAFEANSMSGTVTLRQARARSVDLGSISGDIVLRDVECDRADLHTFSGSIEFASAFAKNGRYELKSHSGDVRLTLPGNTGFEIEATTFSGSVRSDLPLQTQGDTSDRTRRRSLRGVYGDGSAVVAVTTFSGSVLVAKR
jgi:DUF4097 and DUF4098 domain-containing protein YvlB